MKHVTTIITVLFSVFLIVFSITVLAMLGGCSTKPLFEFQVDETDTDGCNCIVEMNCMDGGADKPKKGGLLLPLLTGEVNERNYSNN